MVNRQQLKTGCEHLYRRAGGSTERSGIYCELREADRATIEGSVSFFGEELPIVGSIVDQKHWLVATTDRVVFRSGHDVLSVPFGRLRAVHSLSLEDGNAKRDDTIVLLTDGERYEVRVEPGYPMGGIWNVLRRLQRVWIVTA